MLALTYGVCLNLTTFFGNIQSIIHLKYEIIVCFCREVVVAQLVERLLPIQEVPGSNPVIGKNLLILNICILSTVY